MRERGDVSNASQVLLCLRASGCHSPRQGSLEEEQLAGEDHECYWDMLRQVYFKHSSGAVECALLQSGFQHGLETNFFFF